jgi:hypothetical protein
MPRSGLWSYGCLRWIGGGRADRRSEPRHSSHVPEKASLEGVIVGPELRGQAWPVMLVRW